MSITPLAVLLNESRDASVPIAFRAVTGSDDRVARWGDFRRDVASLRDRLARGPDGRIALWTEDSYAFAVGLFGIWHARRIAVCPPNDQPGTLDALANEVVAGVSDTSLGPIECVSPTTADAARLDFEPLDANAVVAELFTSGTTGRGKAIEKTLSQLSLEVESLERQFGTEAGDAVVFSSASHQHVYGMLFRVLWPLASRRMFHAQRLLHAEELATRLAAAGGGVLVSVPAHLKRLIERDGVRELARACQVVFSSGGPLAASTAARWESMAGAAPIEIFGSTETGGVAWRRQRVSHADAVWTPFPEVSFEIDADDGRLRVWSPFVSGNEEGEGFAMGDRAEHAGDGFRVFGRLDRTLKVGEKRVSLPDLEARLREHRFVDAAALCSLEHAGETRVAAVVVLSAAGTEALAREGRRALGVALSEALAREWDRMLLPRSWRFVDALPENVQGKVTADVLRALFVEPIEAGR